MYVCTLIQGLKCHKFCELIVNHSSCLSEREEKVFQLRVCSCSPQIDEFPINQDVALQLAGLHAQVLWGDHVQGMGSRYDEVEQYLHPRITAEDRNKTREDWKKAIAVAHKVRHGSCPYT